jgi:hypothetical protein
VDLTNTHSDADKFECTSSLKYWIYDGSLNRNYCGDTKSTGSYLIDRSSTLDGGDLFEGQFWDDHAFEIKETATAHDILYSEYMS